MYSLKNQSIINSHTHTNQADRLKWEMYIAEIYSICVYQAILAKNDFG